MKLVNLGGTTHKMKASKKEKRAVENEMEFIFVLSRLLDYKLFRYYSCFYVENVIIIDRGIEPGITLYIRWRKSETIRKIEIYSQFKSKRYYSIKAFVKRGVPFIKKML